MTLTEGDGNGGQRNRKFLAALQDTLSTNVAHGREILRRLIGPIEMVERD